MSLDMYLEKNRSGRYHLGKMFLDCMKSKPPQEIFQIDAATGKEESNEVVLSKSIRLARCLRKMMEPGDVLALGGKNHLDLHIPYYAAMMNGYPLAGVDPFFKYEEIRHLFNLTKPKIAFCQKESADLYDKAARDLGIDVRIVTFDDNGLAKFMDEHDVTEDDGEFKAEEIDTDKIYAWLVPTSGTTGMPKVAALKHQILINQILGYLKMFNIKINGVKNAFNLAPVQWISGYFNAMSMPIMNQIKVQTSTPEDIGHLIDAINKYKPVSMMASPSTMSLILNHEKACNLKCFDMLTITGSKLYKNLALEIKAHLKPTAMLLEAYGQTETIGPALMPDPLGPITNCGKPMPNFVRQVKLVDPDTGNEVTEPNVPGELWTKGPSFTEYYNNPEETDKAFTDGWYKTGDLLYRDENNNFFFYDRIKLLIKYRNYHINPYVLEELIVSKLEGVLEVSVVGIPHETDGQHAVACVVLRPGCDVTAQQIKDLIANELSPSNQLRGGVVFLDSLPKTSSGKVARAQLTRTAAALERE